MACMSAYVKVLICFLKDGLKNSCQGISNATVDRFFLQLPVPRAIKPETEQEQMLYRLWTLQTLKSALLGWTSKFGEGLGALLLIGGQVIEAQGRACRSGAEHVLLAEDPKFNVWHLQGRGCERPLNLE